MYYSGDSAMHFFTAERRKPITPILFTAYNRYEKDRRCIRSVCDQPPVEGFSFDVYLLDDASPDHTGARIREEFPEVQVMNGSGSLYWVGGMRTVWQEALKKEYQAYLLLNDDVELLPDAFVQLFESYRKMDPGFTGSALYIGSTRDTATGKLSYGGRRLLNHITGKNELIQPDPELILPAEMAHANILLVTRQAVDRIGILDGRFTQQLADYDYSLRAFKKAIPLYVCPGYTGICTDDHGKNWLPQETSLRERLRYLYHPKHLAYSEYLYYMRRHFPLFVPVAFLKLWAKTLFPILWTRLKS